MNRQRYPQNTNNGMIDLLGLGFALVSLWLSAQNLQANRAQAVESRRIAEGLEEVNRELDTLNKSDLLCRVKNHIEKEKLQ